MAPTALVVGGTGPTGPHVVGGLLDRGFAVTMLHTGRHERDEIPAVVEHVHTDPFDAAAVDDALGRRTFDVAALMYGRLRDLAPVVARPRRQARHRRRDAGRPRLRRPRGAHAVRAARADPRSHRRARRTGRPQRQGRAHRRVRAGRVRGGADGDPPPLPARVRAAPARAAGVDDRAPAARRAAADHRPRRRPAAALGGARRQRRPRPAARRSTSRSARPDARTTSATRRRRRSARSSRSSPPPSTDRSRSCRCPTTSPPRPAR